MKKEKKLSKKEIKEIVDIACTYKLKYKGYDKEVFKQLVLNNVYTNYLVSSYGRIISINYRGVSGRPSLLKQTKAKTGKQYKGKGKGCGNYLKIVLCIKGEKKTFLVHRLVAIVFIENPYNKEEVNHKDGNKEHNYVWNLEWATPQENIIHGLKTDLIYSRRGEDIGNNKYTEKDINKVCEMLEKDIYTIKKISKKTGVSYDMIRNVRNGKSWTHISKNYNIGKNNCARKTTPTDTIHEICRRLASHKYTLKEISEWSGLSYSMIHAIAKGRKYKNISKQYNVQNYLKLNKI